MNIRKTLLVGLVAVPLALVGCQEEAEYEVEPDGTVEAETDLGVNEAAVDDAVDDAGAAIDNAGEEIEDAANDAADAVDDNVDLGDNAGDNDGL